MDTTTIVIYRVIFRGSVAADFDDLESAQAFVRDKHPGAVFNRNWSPMPPALNGDQAADLPLGVGDESLGNILRINLKNGVQPCSL